jgi:hypothetical protein
LVKNRGLSNSYKSGFLEILQESLSAFVGAGLGIKLVDIPISDKKNRPSPTNQGHSINKLLAKVNRCPQTEVWGYKNKTHLRGFERQSALAFA